MREERQTKREARMAADAPARESGSAPDGIGDALREALAFLRTRLFELYVLSYSLLYLIPIYTYFQIRRRPSEVRTILRAWSTLFIEGARWILGIRYRVEGRGNIPEGPVIFVANHQSYWESIALTSFIPHVNVVSKRGAMKYPVFGWGLREAPMSAVDRDRPGANLRRIVREMRRSFADGRAMLIFPEGTRVPPGGRRSFERGVELLYAHGGAPVVPIVTDAGLHWTAGFRTKRPGLITLRFLPPIPPGLPADAFRQRIERTLNEEKDRLLMERDADDPALRRALAERSGAVSKPT